MEFSRFQNKKRRLLKGLLISAALGCLPWASAVPQSPTNTHILVLGDSLSAEYGLKRGTGWVALLETKLQTTHPGAQVTNASISGDTTAGGRSRLGALLRKHRPSHVIIELGGNDALRGLPLPATENNLREMVRMAQTAKARVLLIGMRMPPNYGQAYTEQFAALFAKVAQAKQVALVPFLLEGIADQNDKSLFQADQIHPTARAQPTMLANVWPELKKLLP